MQPINPADKRRPNVQIAASIRAAILSGELQPGAQLPTGQQLAKFFGVSRMTVQTAVRTLREEGFIRSRTGSGVYVRDQASLPAPSQQEQLLSGVAAFLFEMGHLKHLARTGWLLLGIPQPETVAEHCFRAGVVGIALAALEGANVGRTAALCILHDSHETRNGDVISIARAYVTTAAPAAVTAHQTSAMPHAMAKVLQDLVAEYEAGQTLESQLAHDAHEIETLLQATEYLAQGHDTKAWHETSTAALRTGSARQLAQAIGTANPHSWWSAFMTSNHQPRPSAHGQPRGTGQTQPAGSDPGTNPALDQP
jgi:5'-deoxynucleotidase YfbR-like HD superfamily hydrolase/biotin operon repressor